MNFAPLRADRVLHDTWVFLDKDEIHLFYLAPRVDDNSHRLIGHAISRDWLHWEELPFIELTGHDGAWDSGRIGTGHTFRHDDGLYYMAYTGRIDPQEDIGLAISEDLIHWKKVFDRPVWPQCVRPSYEPRCTDLNPAWRDPYVVRQSDGDWHAYAAARVQDGPLSNRGCVARARLSLAGQWETLPSVAALGEYSVMEVPEIFEFLGAYWLTFNTHSGWGKRLDTASRRVAGGTFYLRAPHPDGPWEKPADNLLIGSGEGRRDAVVARSVAFQGDRLVYHHYTGDLSADSPRALGLPKVLDREGDRLVLRPWAGVRALWREEAPQPAWSPINTLPWAQGDWQITPDALVGCCSDSVAGCTTDLGGADVDLTCNICLEAGDRCGLVLGLDEAGTSGVSVLLDATDGTLAIGHLLRGPYGMRLDAILDRAHLGIREGTHYALRVLKRDRYTEAYLDEANAGVRLVFSTITGPPTRSGTRLVAIVEDGRASYEFSRIVQLEKMPRRT